MHADRGAALRALNPRIIRYGVLYRWDPTWQGRGCWIEVCRVDERQFQGVEHCTVCGVHRDQQPLVDRYGSAGAPSAWSYRPTHLTTTWLRTRGLKGKVLDPPKVVHLCHSCGGEE